MLKSHYSIAQKSWIKTWRRFGNPFPYHAFCQKHVLEIKFWVSFPKHVFWRQSFLQTTLFSSYQTQNLGFTFSKNVFCFPNGIPNGHLISLIKGIHFLKNANEDHSLSLSTVKVKFFLQEKGRQGGFAETFCCSLK